MPKNPNQQILNVNTISEEMERARAQGIYYNVPKLKKETENPKEQESVVPQGNAPRSVRSALRSKL